jgi:hypothetical protein
VPFTSLVEKAMESKGKELLPKIQDVIKSLSQQAKPVPTSCGDPADAKPKSIPVNDSSAKSELEFDLSLPIDLPGLSSGVSSSYSTVARKPVQNESKLASRPKHRQQGESGSRDSKSGGVKPRPSTAGEGKGDSVVSKGKEEGKEEAEKPSVVVTVKDKEKRIARVKKNREDAKKDKPREAAKTTNKADGFHQKDENDKASLTAAPIPSATSTSGKDAKAQEDGPHSVSGSKPTPRRSRRIASLTEDPRHKDDDSDVETDDTTEDYPPKRRTSVDKHDKRGSVKAKKKKPRGRPHVRRRAKVWSSSSSADESEDEIRRLECVGVTDDPDKAKDGNARKFSGQKHPLGDDQEASNNPAKRPRRLSKIGSPASGTQGTDHASTRARKSKTPQRLCRSSKSPLKSPPTVTRFNRQVKPNRKYYTSSEEPEEEMDSETQERASEYSGGEEDT